MTAKLASQLPLSKHRAGPLWLCRSVEQFNDHFVPDLECDRSGHSIDRAATVEALVSAVREAEHALRESISVEEDPTCSRDLNDSCYSTLAALDARAG